MFLEVLVLVGNAVHREDLVVEFQDGRPDSHGHSFNKGVVFTNGSADVDIKSRAIVKVLGRNKDQVAFSLEGVAPLLLET